MDQVNAYYNEFGPKKAAPPAVPQPKESPSKPPQNKKKVAKSKNSGGDADPRLLKPKTFKEAMERVIAI